MFETVCICVVMTDEQKIILYTLSEEYLDEDMLSDIAEWVDEYCHSFCYRTSELISPQIMEPYLYNGTDYSRLAFMETTDEVGMVIHIFDHDEHIDESNSDPSLYVIIDPWCWVPTRQQIRLIFARHWYHRHKSQFE